MMCNKNKFLQHLGLLIVKNNLPIRRKFSQQQQQSMRMIQNQLLKLNKPAVKTIQSPDGDVIDCVWSRSQPAFDHPLLQNHILQEAPTAIPKVLHEQAAGSSTLKFHSHEYSHDSSRSWKQQQQQQQRHEHDPSQEIVQRWHQNGHCPQGTVAIRRTQAQDLLRAAGGSLENYRSKRGHGLSQVPQPQSTIMNNNSGHEHAIAYMEAAGSTSSSSSSSSSSAMYYGSSATMNVWSPNVEVASEFSLTQMWILAGSFNSDLNSIEAGWQVSPQLYGDNNPRLFTYWTTDGYQATGCYNLLCSGFVQTSNMIALGAVISPVSSYQGTQYDISILIWKDPILGNWWMQFGNSYLVGYWPATLFTHLNESATMLEWGGEVVNSEPGGVHTSTQMGSGQFAEEGFGQASYVRNLKYVDSNNILQNPDNTMQTLAEDPNCYDIQSSSNDNWGVFFYYGGPGRNPNCP
ncbi:unnamed protein product [Sphagnum compactum]